MLTLARRNLFKGRGRLAISIGGIAFVVTLMMLVSGLYLAFDQKIRNFYDGMRVDAWVVQRGTTDKLGDSVLSDKLGKKLRKIPGVVEVIPYTTRIVSFRLGDEDVELLLMGFDPVQAGPNTGPLRMVSGRRSVRGDEIIVDKVFAHGNGLSLGDKLRISGEELTVTGISAGGDLISYQTAYVTNHRMRDLLGDEHLVNAFLLRLQPGTDLSAVRADIDAVTDHKDVRSMATIVEQNGRTIREGFLPVLKVLLTIGFCVGVAVVGLTISSTVIEHRREYGVLKALGARPLQMLVVVMVQALTAAVAGYLAGVGVSLLVARAAETLVPQFITSFTVSGTLAIGAAALGMGLFAALMPLRSIARVDAAIVFRA
jgi:putative ABC transport system permease protein